MNGSTLRFDTGFIPFGNSEHFLYPNQLSKTGNCRIGTNFKTIVSQVKCPISLVNYCLVPKATFEDDLAPLFDDSSVKIWIDKMLTCDSLGIGDNSIDISNYVKEKIAKFEARITIKGKVFVELVWNSNIQDVLSNYGIALKALERVSEKLSSSNQPEQDNKLCFDQLEEDIIEEFFFVLRKTSLSIYS